MCECTDPDSCTCKYSRFDRHTFSDRPCTLNLTPEEIAKWMLNGDDKTIESCRMRFEATTFVGEPFIPYFHIEPIQLELFPHENLQSPVQFEKQCFQFCGDACTCGKKDFLDSYTKPYRT